tara:strand:+ start:505 stop:1482 length:978 start_codon:yes stop_codon:yes gene_type:complete
MSSLARLGKSVGVAGCLVTLSDLTQPIAPFATYIAAVSFILLIFIGIVKLFSKNWSENQSIFSYFICIICVLSSTLTFYQHSTENAKKTGIIASKVTTVKDIQNSLGIINDQLIAMNTSLTSIDDKMDNTKKEVSTNPRKELSNLGIPWDSIRFYEAIAHNDEPIIDLFFQGGMQIDRMADKGTGNSIFTHIIYQRKNNWLSILKKAKRQGYNFDTKIRYNYGSESATPLFLAFKQEEYDIAEFILKQGVEHIEAKQKFNESLSFSRRVVKDGEPSECTRNSNDHFNTGYASCRSNYKRWKERWDSANRMIKKTKIVFKMLDKYS